VLLTSWCKHFTKPNDIKKYISTKGKYSVTRLLSVCLRMLCVVISCGFTWRHTQKWTSLSLTSCLTKDTWLLSL